MEFKQWEDYTEKEQLESTYSDMFKDVNGFRPRGFEMTVAELEVALDALGDEMEIQQAENKAAEEQAVKNFWELIAKVSDTCGTDKTGAMRILIQAEATDWFDWGRFCYENRLPFIFKPEGIDFESLDVHYHLWAA